MLGVSISGIINITDSAILSIKSFRTVLARHSIHEATRAVSSIVQSTFPHAPFTATRQQSAASTDSAPNGEFLLRYFQFMLLVQTVAVAR